MTKKTYPKQKQPPHRSPWLWLIVGGVLLIIIGGLWTWASSRASSKTAPEIAGSPRLTVDQTVIDEGEVKLNTQLRTTFRLKNVGDQPLRILGEPQVELVEGC